MEKENGKFKGALDGKTIPLLILDNKWHRLFNQAEATPQIKKLEQDLGELIKKEGKLNTESKDLRKIKNNLMKEIVSNMDGAQDGTDKKVIKIVEESKRLINEINEKLKEYQEELLDLPREIEQINKELMLLTMEQCYQVMLNNTEEIDEIGKWIKTIRIELKKNVVKKQDMEVKNVELYSYMNDIFGSDVMDLFDIQYDVESKKQEMLLKQREVKAMQRATASEKSELNNDNKIIFKEEKDKKQ